MSSLSRFLRALTLLSLLAGGGCGVSPSPPPSGALQLTPQTSERGSEGTSVLTREAKEGAERLSVCPPLLSLSELEKLSEKVTLGAPPRYARAPSERGAWALSVGGLHLSRNKGGSLSLQGWRWYLSARGGAQALPPQEAPQSACAVAQRWVASSDQLWLLTRFSADVPFKKDALARSIEKHLAHPHLSTARGALLITPLLARELEALEVLQELDKRGWRPSFETLNKAPSEERVWIAIKRGL